MNLGRFELNQIYSGDCALLMAELPPDCIDLVVTSPPYDNLRDYHGYTFDYKSVAFQLYRVIKPGGVVVWVVGDATINGSETGTSFRQALHFMELGFNLHDTMIYRKNALSYPVFDKYYPCFEYMFVFSKLSPKTINLIADRKNHQANKRVTGNERQSDGSLTEMSGRRKGAKIKEYGIRWNVWMYNTGKGHSASDNFAHDHPAIYPEALASDHILSWSNPGDIVFDPMCGSGTTCKMAKQNGRQFLGFDISVEYCEIARKRVAWANPPLFTI